MANGYSVTIGKHPARGWKAQVSRLEVGTMRPRLWREDVPGMRLDVVWGRLRRPVARFYKPDFWSSDHKTRSKYNPWNSGNHWFMLDIPFVVLPFLAMIVATSWGNPGFYIGGRTARMNNWIDWALVEEWVAPGKDVFARDADGNYIRAWGSPEDEGQVHIELSATVRGELLDR